MGWVMSVFLIAYGVFQVPAGLLGDRLGARGLLALLVVGWSLTTAAIALVPASAALVWLPLAWLLILRVVFGLFQAGAFPVFARVVADWVPLAERGSAQGLMWTSSRVGGALTPFLLGPLIGLLGWRLPFGALAGLGVLWGVAFWLWFRNRPHEMPQVNAAELELIRAGQGPPQGRPPVIGWRRLLGSRNTWCLCLMYGSCGFAGNFFFTMLPIYLRDHRHLPAETTRWLFGVPIALGIGTCAAGGLVSDWLIRRWDSRKWGRRVNGVVGLTLAGLAFAATV
jgi:MFS family permease